MNKILKRLLTGLIGLLLITVGGVHLMAYSMESGDQKIVELFAKEGVKVSVDHLVAEGRSVRVVATDPKLTDSTLIVFVHGAPGSWDAYKKYMLDTVLLQKARLVAYDRPGYGGSGAESMIDISEQADILKHVIEQYRLPHVVVVGHSYGGPIVGNIAARYPHLIDRAVMIAPLNDPENEPIFWFSHIARWKATKWLLPNGVKVAGEEKFSHAAELAKMQDLWSELTVPILHIHGDKDGLAPSLPNIAWSQKHIPADVLRLEVLAGEGHLVLWQAYYRVSGLILDFIQ